MKKTIYVVILLLLTAIPLTGSNTYEPFNGVVNYLDASLLVVHYGENY